MTKENIVFEKDIQSRIALQKIFEEILVTFTNNDELPKNHPIPIALQDYKANEILLALGITNGNQALVYNQTIGWIRAGYTFLDFVDTLIKDTDCQAVICQSPLYETVVNDKETTIKEWQNSKAVISRNNRNIVLVKVPSTTNSSPGMVH
ncbi:hypothetical protein KKE75_05385 [Patescibacteria group bacterium]|nr:hypothetical protein [Patescibacteria group bacterium]